MSEEDKKQGDEADLAVMLDLSKKKKKKDKKKSSKKDKGEKSEKKSKDEGSDAVSGDDAYYAEQRGRLAEENDTFEAAHPDEFDRKADYTYTDLLDRVVNILTSNNPEEKKRRTMQPPKLNKLGTKKTLWINYQEICTILQRSPEHVFQFFMAELGTDGSIDGNQRLVIKGKYVPKYIESLLKKYIVEYVTCQMCRSPNTELTKDSSTRLQFCNCRDCGSSRSVAPIRSGYHATSRADRRAARNAMG
jgi:translation initiation factor 2 subunit 2|eukprot:110185_1